MYWALKYKQAQEDTVSEANPPKQLKAHDFTIQLENNTVNKH